MIIDFTLENWMSFRDPVTFTMLSGEEGDHRSRLPILKDKTCVLPIAAIFGGNASGKSNFVKSLEFVRDFIIGGSKPNEEIQVNTFKLDKNSEMAPAKFGLILSIDDKIFSYEFAVARSEVIYEAYYEIKNDKKNCLYRIKNEKIYLKSDLKQRIIIKSVYTQKRKNQLLLTAVSHATGINFPVYDWFANNLILIQPNSKNYTDRLLHSRELRDAVNQVLKYLDSGVESIDVAKNFKLKQLQLNLNKISIENKSIIDKKTNNKNYKNIDKNNLLKELNKEAIRNLIESKSNDRLISLHKSIEGELNGFEISEESEGTIRLLELIPIFIELSKQNSRKIFVFDEIERSMHTQLIDRLICAYLKRCNTESRSQLIFTTHNVQLMDDACLRMDEIWFTERNGSGITDLFSLGDFKDIELESNVRKNYLFGRYGGGPELSLTVI